MPPPPPVLSVRNLKAAAGETPILHGVSLELPAGAVHAVMGPNGSGKSTLAAVLAGHPDYAPTGGEAVLAGSSMLELEPEERAAAGLFLAFQNPASLPGVPLHRFLFQALGALRAARGEEAPRLAPFLRGLRASLALAGLPETFLERALNDGASGGEKKRLELVQMLTLEPRLVILDEIDSGLDIDALRAVGLAVAKLRAERPETAFLVITHYARLLREVPVGRVHVLEGGRIARSGGPELADELERTGYVR